VSKIDPTKEKELGNAAYLQKDFETALSHYQTATELEPTNIVYLNNMAGGISQTSASQ
jgi:cytochrome c-type biogenesis protein CcmH/NrfG